MSPPGLSVLSASRPLSAATLGRSTTYSGLLGWKGELLTYLDQVGIVADDGPVGVVDGGPAVGIAVDLAGDCRQRVAAADGVGCIRRGGRDGFGWTWSGGRLRWARGRTWLRCGGRLGGGTRLGRRCRT